MPYTHYKKWILRLSVHSAFYRSFLLDCAYKSTLRKLDNELQFSSWKSNFSVILENSLYISTASAKIPYCNIYCITGFNLPDRLTHFRIVKQSVISVESEICRQFLYVAVIPTIIIKIVLDENWNYCGPLLI